MKKLSKEEIMSRIFENVVRDMLISMVKSDEFSFDFYIRDDKEEIEKRLTEASKEISIMFVNKLKSMNYLDKEPDRTTFKQLLKETIEEYKVKNK